MSDFFIKEMPDGTITLMTENGYIIGKFDNVDDTNDIFLNGQHRNNSGPMKHGQPANNNLLATKVAEWVHATGKMDRRQPDKPRVDSST